ncbi:hypothetical protein E2C01_075691 [Portunus trituberculatus]|uniref:Uncharacterized protein n=1 Tax=Portunus trituberculatus TaxID=210409 RepID=A0A5B7I6Q7_PORTR|nr:hypothetical protein [Portunus trituberculatus]
MTPWPAVAKCGMEASNGIMEKMEEQQGEGCVEMEEQQGEEWIRLSQCQEIRDFETEADGADREERRYGI